MPNEKDLLQEPEAIRALIQNAANGASEAFIQLFNFAEETHPKNWDHVINTISELSAAAAETFFAYYLDALDALIRHTPKIVAFLAWVQRKAAAVAAPYQVVAVRAYHIWNARIVHSLDPDFVLTFGDPFTFNSAVDFAQQLCETLDDDTWYRSSDLDNYFYLACNLMHPPDYNWNLRFSHPLTPDLALALAIASGHDLDYPLTYICERTRDYSRDLARALDYTLYEIYAMALVHADLRSVSWRARILTRALTFTKLCDFAYTYVRRRDSTFARIEQLSFANLYESLTYLSYLEYGAASEEWQTFTASLKAIMIEYRDIGHDWNFNLDQVAQLDRYLKATYLLNKSLNQGEFATHDVVQACLLLPPTSTKSVSVPNKSPLPIPRPLHLDAVGPKHASLNHIMTVVVGVRQTNAPFLLDGAFVNTLPDLRQPFWPESGACARLRITLVAPQCQILEDETRTFLLAEDRNSPLFHFRLIPRTLGFVKIAVALCQEKVHLGSTQIHTVVCRNITSKLKYPTSEVVSVIYNINIYDDDQVQL